MSGQRKPGGAGLPMGSDDLEDLSRLRNAPGLETLSYRVGDYESFLEQMIHALMSWGLYPLATAPAELADTGSSRDQEHPSPAKLQSIRPNLFEEGHWILGLLRAWSTVGDVLTFYQERLINEGYLRTARQRQSLHHLVRLLDYRPEPAVGGSVELAFSVTAVEGLPPRMELVAGTEVTSVPPPGEDPQTFEITRVLDARKDLNLLQPKALHQEIDPVLPGGATELKLAGTGLGLDPGAGILVRARIEDVDQTVSPSVVFFRAVGNTKAISEDPAHTILSWQEPLEILSWQEPLTSMPLPQRLGEAEMIQPEVFALRQEARLFGYQAPAWNDQSMAVKRSYRSPLGGVKRLLPSESWETLHQGLPETTVRCLACDEAGNLFAGTADEGLWYRTAGAATWQKGSGTELLDVLSLATEPTGGVLAGTSSGSIYRSTDGGRRWSELTGRSLGRANLVPRRRSRYLLRLPETPIRSLLTMGEGEGWSLAAGTDSGVYLSTDLGATWLPCNRGFPGSEGGETSLVVHSLVSDGGRGLYAGTAAGVFHDEGRRFGRSWRASSRGLPGSDPLAGPGGDDVKCLARYQDRRRGKTLLFAGTLRGVFRSTDGGARWRPARDGMEESASGGFPSIRSLVLLEDPITVTNRLYAASETGLWTSEDLGDSWQRIPLDAPEISACADGLRGRLLTASPLAGFEEEEWPGFHSAQGRIDLDRLVSAPADDSWVVLAPDPDLEDPPPVGFYQVKSTSTIDRSDFTLEAAVTRIEVKAADGLERHHHPLELYPLRDTRVFLHSQDLALLPDTLPADPERRLTEMCGVLERLGLAGNHPLIVATEPTDGAESTTSDSVAQVGLVGGEELDDQDPPIPTGLTTFGRLDSELRELIASFRRSSKRSQEHSAILSWFHQTVPSLSVYGNVVTANEGRSVLDEVLGDGDASKTFQRFQLSEPLAYHRGAPTPRSTLCLWVQDQPWREVPRLYGEAPDARVFEIELDHEGRATVVFGDGIHGARLPTGRGNVVASYRTGTTDREIPPGSARLMSSRPLGLDRVANPLAGTAGAPAEEPDSIRRRAPLSLRTLGRIVSLDDYRDFASTYPGIDDATASELVLAGKTVVHLTVAIRGQDPPSEGLNGLLEALRTAIEESRGDDQPLVISPVHRVDLMLTGSVKIAGHVDWDELLPRLRSALHHRFGFHRSRFGETLSFAEAVRVLQRVPGVESVDIDTFRRSDSENEGQPIERGVVAGAARWDDREQRILPAELVGLAEPELKKA